MIWRDNVTGQFPLLYNPLHYIAVNCNILAYISYIISTIEWAESSISSYTSIHKQYSVTYLYRLLVLCILFLINVINIPLESHVRSLVNRNELHTEN